jgi:hypothetical protein
MMSRKSVLVTGANRGIGEAPVEEALVRDAARVHAGDRQHLEHADARVVPLVPDVTDDAQMRSAGPSQPWVMSVSTTPTTAANSNLKEDVNIMPKAVRYDEFGGIDVLRVDEVERPVPGDGQVLVRVKAAGINPSEAAIRTGAVAQIFPSTFPSGQGSDLAGVIEEVGAVVGGFSPGDEVIGFSNKRASQAELVLVEADDLTRKPETVS